MKKILSLLLLAPLLLQAQEPALKKLEVFSGFSFSRPIGVNKKISFQSGIIAEIGTGFNFHLQKDNYLSAGLNFSSRIYNIEGYFISMNGKDNFIITPDNVKVNTVIITPVSLNIGFKKIVNGKGLVGIDILTGYTNKITRRYKIGPDEIKEKYDLNRKINFGIDGITGLVFPNKKMRIDFLISYSFSSIGSNTHFKPFTSGIRIVGAIGK